MRCDLAPLRIVCSSRKTPINAVILKVILLERSRKSNKLKQKILPLRRRYTIQDREHQCILPVSSTFAFLLGFPGIDALCIRMVGGHNLQGYVTDCKGP